MGTAAELIEEIKKMSVLELSELVKALEEEFGVSATAAVAAAPAAAPGGGDGAAAAEAEPATVDVVLTGPGDKKIQVIKVVRAATGLGLKEAKALVDEAPKPVKEGVDREEGEKLKGEIEGDGGPSRHYRFGDQQLNVHGPGLDPHPLARVPVQPGNSDLCFVWAGPIET